MVRLKLHAFDFDGTITRRDSLIEFIRYTEGSLSLALWAVMHLPQLLLMKMGRYPNDRLKENLCRLMFGGGDELLLKLKARLFASDRGDLLRPGAMAAIQAALDRGEKVCVVSASPSLWVEPFFHDYPDVVLLCTKLKTENGKFTGRFAGANCYGEEKVRRLKAAFPERGQYHIVAYGDSRGDREMLAYADEAHYKPFRD